MDSEEDTLAAEIEAMAAIGRALADLPDAAARARVIRWAQERFDPGGASRSAAPAAEAADPTLEVESLADVFDDSARPGADADKPRAWPGPDWDDDPGDTN
jgi:hypothetical protein